VKKEFVKIDPKLLTSAIFSSVFVILTKVFSSELFERLFILDVFVYLVVGLLFIVTYIWALNYLYVRFGEVANISVCFIPVGILTLTFGFLIFVPTTALKLDINFAMNLDQRLVIINEIKEQSASLHNPLEFRESVKFNERIEYTYSADGFEALFYTFQGLPDSFAGFVYSEADLAPTNETFSCGYLIQKVKYRKHWYWISCT
jgi:hypothetical protein